MTKPIVVVGSINLDLVTTSGRLPAPGETVTGQDFHTFFGGKGANQAVAASKLGHPVVMIGRVGEDAFGSQLIAGLMGAGVNASCIQKVPGPSGVALIMTDNRGENSIVVVPGANSQVTPLDLENHRGVLENAGIILTQLEIPMETVLALADFALEAGVPLMLDPAPVQNLPPTLLSKLAWITPNETETSKILNVGNGIADLEAAADALLAMGAKNVVLKLGPRGALVAENKKSKSLVPGFSVRALDTTAAGDCFNGAFAAELLRGRGSVAAARYANAAAAISVTRRGAQPSMPYGTEVRQFLAAHPG